MFSDYNKDDFLDENDEELDAILKSIAEEIEQDENKNAINNPERIMVVSYVYRLLSGCYYGTDVGVKCKINEPYRSMACVSVNGLDLVFKQPQVLAECAKLASVVDIYAKTDGTVQIDFTFHSMTIPLD